MCEREKELALERKLAEFELHQLEIEMGARKIGFAGSLLCWLDEIELEFPEAADSIKPLAEKLLVQIDALENKLEADFDALLKVSDLNA